MTHTPSDLDYIVSANTHDGVFDWENAKPKVKEFFVKLLGEDNKRTGKNAHIDIEYEGRNKLRAELRQKVENL